MITEYRYRVAYKNGDKQIHFEVYASMGENLFDGITENSRKHITEEGYTLAEVVMTHQITRLPMINQVPPESFRPIQQ